MLLSLSAIPVHSGERKRTCEPPLLVVQDPAAPSPFPTPRRPSSSHSLAHEEDTADGCPGVRRGFFFFLKQCLPETCSSHDLLLGARQMVLACLLPSCSLCSQRRGARWHQGSVSSDGVTSKFAQLQLWGHSPQLLKQEPVVLRDIRYSKKATMLTL